MTAPDQADAADCGRPDASSGPCRRGLLIILSSPSGAGKSTVARRLREWDPSIRFSVSATTRPPRPGEVDGREYHFVTDTTFAEMVARGDMLEHARVFGHHYGSPAGPVAAAVSTGADTLFDIDWQGGDQIRASTFAADCVSVFLLPPSLAELERRLHTRKQDSDEVIAGRMAQSRGEISHWTAYDYVIVNQNLERTVAQVTGIVQAERLRRHRQPWLERFVERLNREKTA